MKYTFTATVMRSGPDSLNREVRFISRATLRIHYAFSYAAILTAGCIAT